MALRIASLNSGSNGNCYYIGNSTEAVLVDAGLSCREMEKRMDRIGLNMSTVKAVFISHEHADHIFGLPVIAKKYQLPVYITEGTLRSGRQNIQPHLVVSFSAHQPVQIGAITITAFPKFHDACDPHSFMVSEGDVNIGVFTDIGTPCDQLRKYFALCHAAFLESNYDEALLLNGRYPWSLKNRIRGGHGHLSNAQAFEIFSSCRSSQLSHLLLAHLSRDNNDPALVEALFRGTHTTKIVVASRYKESQVYEITGTRITPPAVQVNPSTTAIRKSRFTSTSSPRPEQLSFF